ncbi:RNA polymerase sigma factor [Alicyclobacillus tolerans]|uniref:RNA polymerase sigma factor n=1 Tax=Alicyclobacillus tolerans TaxID=90970 RepID=UPI001F2479F6|nr:RNA polymerase sigma factor [Alicyclobacillus tolerans]MCF8564570.1 RNA polymerase sigma factor [Alicyclobacillus tolerans]
MFDTLSANEAIEKLFELYADDIYRYARYTIPDTDDARDVVQEVFMRAFRAWDSFRHDSNPKTWLFHIAKNYMYDLLRKKRTERKHQTDFMPDISEVSVPLETLLELEETVAALKPDHQQVILLRSIEGMSVDETAEILGWSPAKVKTTLHRAIKELRGLLDQKEGEVNEYRGTSGGTVNPTVQGQTKSKR